ncbi:sigma intracellular receptor 2 [Pristis pectinata]|uniref:sigma intracellular receptor 2 n=1 Tax=Pristis pectinata TaxID=685728 RepID=UPI00223CA73D|nr:sigma intracellular receptor 2 [Pristis pectinata]
MRPLRRSPTPDNTMASPGRLLECIFCFYFITHIPVTLAIDLQALLPRWMFPAALQGLLRWYAAKFKDPMIMDPPAWFSACIVCEALLQMPFFPVAAYAFYKGSRSWIRTPAIVYSTHVATTVISILGHILFNDFSKSTYPGPNTLSERLSLLAIYIPYLLIPVMILLTMLYSKRYNSFEEKKKQ